MKLVLLLLLVCNIYAMSKSNKYEYGMFCNDSQIDSIIKKDSEFFGESVDVAGVYSSKSVKQLPNGNYLVFVTYFYKPVGNVNLVKLIGKTGKDIGYAKMMKEFNPRNKITKIHFASFYTCNHNPKEFVQTLGWEEVYEDSIDESLLMILEKGNNISKINQ